VEAHESDADAAEHGGAAIQGRRKHAEPACAEQALGRGRRRDCRDGRAEKQEKQGAVECGSWQHQLPGDGDHEPQRRHGFEGAEAKRLRLARRQREVRRQVRIAAVAGVKLASRISSVMGISTTGPAGATKLEAGTVTTPVTSPSGERASGTCGDGSSRNAMTDRSNSGWKPDGVATG
jgi:hypothetical protein